MASNLARRVRRPLTTYILSRSYRQVQCVSHLISPGVSAPTCSKPRSTIVAEESFEYVDAPVERIAGADVPMPYAANLERMLFPRSSVVVDDIVRAAKGACYRSTSVAATA